MNPTNLIHAARAKRQTEMIRSLEQTFTDFAYPVYLFGSFANGNFHGYSDIDLVILVSKQQAKQAYNEACDKLAGFNTPYDILTCQSVDELDNTIQSTLQPINNPQRSTSNRKYQQGMTLIEIMIALLIGAFLLGGILHIFINSKQTYRMQEGLSRMQENGRFAMSFLERDIRMAGFRGCNSTTTPTNNLNSPTDFLNAFGTAIEGFESTSASAWTPTINAAITSPLGGSDVITIRRADDQSFTVTTHASATANLTLDASATTAELKSTGFLKSDGTNNYTTAIVSDCSATAVFQVTGIAGTVLSHATGLNSSPCVPCNASNDLGKTYVGAQVYPINTISFYVRTGAGGQPSLYRRIGSNAAEEMVEGIENMQILYGEDTDADSTANYYVPANSVVNMGNVVSIRISLLVRTIDDNLAASPLTYTYNGATTTPTDRRLRRVFNSTIAIRNRLP